jgi:hypothetical protein
MFKNNIIYLFIIDFIIIALHIMFASRTVFFDLDQEANLPTYYQAIKLIVIGSSILWFIISRAPARAMKRYLYPISLFLIYLGFDEGFMLHETAEMVLRQQSSLVEFKLTFITSNTSYNSSLWVLVFMPLIIFLIGLFLLNIKKMAKAFKHASTPMFIGAGFFVAVIVFEVLNSRGLENQTHYQILMIMEEGSEKIGASFFAVFAQQLYLAHRAKAGAKKTKQLPAIKPSYLQRFAYLFFKNRS